MDPNRLNLLIQTLKHLRLKQIYYQLYYLIRNKLYKGNYVKELKTQILPLNWYDQFFYANSYTKENTFTFLNLTYHFEDCINWNHKGYGKLWTYNLNYFDFLNQKLINPDTGLKLIHNYVKNEESLKDGKEPYPISLRGINWIKFLSNNAIYDHGVNQVLKNHYQRLIHNLEFHLLGNHLLENGYSLLFGAYYFRDESFYREAKKILTKELKEQILKDGGHFELSPMYHQILLHRLLDIINLIRLNNWKSDTLLPFLEKKANKMLSWLEAITLKNGTVPMVNDSTYGIAPTSNELFSYAKQLGIKWKPIPLSDSGYRMFRKKNYELLVDVGNIGPSYQPGHAHSDTFNFELYYKNQPVIVDTGISTYEKNTRRIKERSTASHNTVEINNQEQTEVWDGFRVARRAKIVRLNENTNTVSATHNGYKKLGILHTRNFICDSNKIIIQDTFSKGNGYKKSAFIHLHPDVNRIQITDNIIHIIDGNIEVVLEGDVDIKINFYRYSLGFNKLVESKKIVINFTSDLTTTINFN
ncbi:MULTISPECIES: alginate lyase family protein [Arenibacter]|uniref:alginate lyase family protein n=1 Tax=Arenibacter TaxID=178469 RepID=UPI0004DF7572|nr:MULTISPECIES: alginate lyase family protein [Arenibacter]GBF18520.1 heparin-sulfate lyase precursor [Arenibacter sp. NBRC 103722]